MKKFIVISLVLLCGLNLFAAENNGEQTLFGSGEIKHGGFGGPEVKFTKILDDPAIFVGGRGGWIINSTFSIGLGGYGLVTNHDLYKSADKDTTERLNLAYGGLVLEYINSSNSIIHFTANTLVGAGATGSRISTNRGHDLWDSDCDISDDYSAFFVIEPAVNLDLNVCSFMRISAGVSYRFITNVDYRNYDGNDFSGINGNLCFKFGKF